MKTKYLTGFVAIAMMAVLTGCGGSSSSTTAATTETTVAVSDLSTLPELSQGAVDLTASLSKSLAKAEGDVGDTAQGGCMAISFFKPMAISNLKLSDVFKCYIETTQTGAGKDANGNFILNIPSDSYAYYQISAPSSKTFKVRVKNDSSTGTFKMGVCETSDGTTYKHANELALTGTTATKTWSGDIWTHFDIPEAQVVENSDGNITRMFGKTHFDIVMASEAAMTQAFALSNISTTSSTSYAMRNPDPIDSTTNDVTSSTAAQDVFRLTFDYDSAGGFNVTSGSFRNAADTAKAILYAKFNATDGTSMMYSDMVQDSGDFDGLSAVQYFNPATSPPVVTATGSISLSGVTLTASDIVTAAEGLSAVTFTDSWDCTAGTSSFTTIDATGFSYAACDTLQSEFSDDMGSGSSQECFSTSVTGNITNCSTFCPALIASGSFGSFTNATCLTSCAAAATCTAFKSTLCDNAGGGSAPAIAACNTAFGAQAVTCTP